MRKIAIYGGAFNPIHNGHIVALQEMNDKQLFDEIWLMPSGIPPYKQELQKNTFHRLNMCQIIEKDLPFVTIKDTEVKKERVSYTYNTLMDLKSIHPDILFYWVIGYDNLYSIETWYKGRLLLENFGLVVLNRGGYSQVEAMDKINGIQSAYTCEIIEVQMPNIELSSSTIRNRISKHKSIFGYTTPKVIDYINKEQLYLS